MVFLFYHRRPSFFIVYFYWSGSLRRSLFFCAPPPRLDRAFPFVKLLQLVRHQVLHALAFRAGVVGAITFQQIDTAPHAEAGAQGNHEGLKDFDCAVEEFHGDLLLKIKSLRPVGYTPEIVIFISCQPQRKLICRCILGPGVNKKSSRDGRIAVLFSRMTGFPHKRRQHSLLSPP